MMARYFEEIRRIVERHGGRVEKFIGDAVMAVFGVPVAHEDDALRGGARRRRDPERLTGQRRASRALVPTGVNTGEVVAGEARRSSRATRSTSRRGSSRGATRRDPDRRRDLALVRDAVEVEPSSRSS